MTKSKPRIGHRWSILLVLCSIIAILPFLLLCAYVYPINDDFSFALQHLNTSVLQSVHDSYMSWSGRYLATFLSAANPYVISDTPLSLFKIYAIFVTIAFILTFWASTFICCRKHLTVLESFGLGSLMFLIFIALIPNVPQAFYWFSSYTAYSIPLLLYMMLVALIATNTKTSYCIACFLTAIVPGGNEIITVITVGTLAYLAFTYRKKKFYFLFSLSIVSALIVILSPGNAVRMTHQLSDSPYLWSLAVSFAQTLSWIFLWCPALIIATVIYVPLYGKKIACSSAFNVDFKIFLGFFLLTVLLAHVPVTLGLSSVMTDRTANCLLVFFIIGYFFAINILLKQYPALTDKFVSLFSNIWFMGAAVFCFLFIGSFSINSAFTTATVDLITGKAAHYAKTQQHRINLVKQHKNADIIALPPIGLTSKSLFIKEIGTNPNGGFARDFAQIHGCKAKVYIKEDNVIFEDNLSALKNHGKRIRANE